MFLNSEENEDENDEGENYANQNSVSETVENNSGAETTEDSESIAKVEDNALADIALPSDSSKEAAEVPELPVKEQSNSTGSVAEEVVEIENIELPPEPTPQPVINDVQATEAETEASDDTM